MLDFNCFMDFHNHTIWSDGDDSPEEIIINAINHQIEAVGITDHFCNEENTEAVIQGISKRKIPVSVGSDTHSLIQYNYGRLKAANEMAKKLNYFIYHNI